MYQTGTTGMQEVIQMCSSFETNKSTKGASKLRRDLINGEIANLRDLLPLPSSTRQRLSQLQLMALVCVYVRKANYFQQVFKRFHELGNPYGTPNIGFSKALSGFLIMMTQNGKLLYISDNAAEYLGHSMEDLLIHGDSVYDIIDKADHGTVQSELLKNSNTPNSGLGEETRLFLCRMNVSRNARRQMRFGDQKVVLLQGHYLSYLPLCSRNEPVFVATCTPVAMPETRECVVQGATNVFTTIHAMDMKFMHVDRNGEYYLGYTRSELGGISWYQLIHWNYMREAQSKHRLISQSEQEKSCILLLRLQTRSGGWIWVHCVLQVKDSPESGASNTTSQSSQQSVIVATNQVLSDREAAVMRTNAWIYHYYTVQTKLQYGLAYSDGSPGSAAGSPGSQAAVAARLVAAAAYFPTQPLINYGTPSPQPHLHHQPQPIAHHQISPDPSSSNGAYGSSPLMTSQHYAGTPGHPYNYHHHRHVYEMSSLGTGMGTNIKKESPLDFSLAGSPIPFDFHLGSSGYPTTSYWTHHHPQYHGGGGYTSRVSDGSPSSTASNSATSPQAWSTPGSTTHQAPTQKHHQLSNTSISVPLNPSHLSPTSGSSRGISVPSGRKRTKKQIVEVNERSLSPTMSPDASLARRLYSPGMFAPTGSNEHSVATMATMFPYHTRSRHFYKMSGDESLKEDTLGMMTCPLTPSPIWEGQTQRVPEIHVYNDTTTGGMLTSVGSEFPHCVPTYQPYLPFGPTTVPGSGSNPPSYGFGFGYYGTSNSGLTTGPIMFETGSPNKENRLPPTPESSDHDGENEENRPLKWETL